MLKTLVFVETPLETCGWKLRFSQGPEMRCSLLPRLLRALQKNCAFAFTCLLTMGW